MDIDYTAYLDKASKPFVLDATRNTRDLGGFDGNSIKTGRYLRSDAPFHLTDHDQEVLAPYQVGCVIDFRTELEINRAPDSSIGGSMYVNYPLLDGMAEGMQGGVLPPSLTKLYCDMLDKSQDMMLKIFRQLNSTKSCIMYHCTGGKDRTGVVSMLLMRLADVPDEQIVADYAVSGYYMREVLQQQKALAAQAGFDAPQFLFESDPETMKQTLAYLDETYGGSRKYLLQIGMTKDEVTWLRDSLVK